MYLMADFGIAGTLLEDGASSTGSVLAKIGKAVAPVADDLAAPLINSQGKKSYTIKPSTSTPASSSNLLSNTIAKPNPSNNGVTSDNNSLTNTSN